MDNVITVAILHKNNKKKKNIRKWIETFGLRLHKHRHDKVNKKFGVHFSKNKKNLTPDDCFFKK